MNIKKVFSFISEIKKKKLESQEFEKRYKNDVFDIIALTSANPISCNKSGGKLLWDVSIRLVAWRKIDQNSKLNIEKKSVCWKIDEEERNKKSYWKDVSEDTIVKLRVQESEYSFKLVEVLDLNVYDEELDQLLQQNLKPILLEDELFGVFQLDRYLEEFSKEVNWHNETLELTIGSYEDVEIEESVSYMHKLYFDWETFYPNIKEFTCKKLLRLANDWRDENITEEITKNQFLDAITLTGISIYIDGDFEIDFGDGGMFLGHIIIVSGNVDGDLSEASIAG